MMLVTGEFKEQVPFILSWLPGLFWHGGEVKMKPWLWETTKQVIGSLHCKVTVLRTNSVTGYLSHYSKNGDPGLITHSSTSLQPSLHRRNSHLSGKSHWYHRTDVFRSLLGFSPSLDIKNNRWCKRNDRWDYRNMRCNQTRQTRLPIADLA